MTVNHGPATLSVHVVCAMSGRSVRSGVGPEFEKGDGRLRPSLQQRLPGAEGPPEDAQPLTPRRACGGSWSTWSAVSNLTSRAGELRSAPSGPDDRDRATG